MKNVQKKIQVNQKLFNTNVLWRFIMEIVFRCKCHKDGLLYMPQKIQNLKESYSQAMESQYDVCIEDLFNQVS